MKWIILLVITTVMGVGQSIPLDSCTGGGITAFGSMMGRFGNFSCQSIPVQNVPYQVTFTFLETVATVPNQRLFQVKVNDQIMFDKLDLFASCGFQAKCTKSVVVIPTNRVITTTFLTQSQNSLVFGIDYTPLVGTLNVPILPYTKSEMLTPIGGPQTITLQAPPTAGYPILVLFQGDPNGDTVQVINFSTQTITITPPPMTMLVTILYWTFQPQPSGAAVVDWRLCMGATLQGMCNGMFFLAVQKPSGGVTNIVGVPAPAGLVLDQRWSPVN